MEYWCCFAQHIIFSGCLGFRELLTLQHCRFSQQVRSATSYEDNRLFSQLLILKFSQNFLQLSLAELLVLMGRFMFGVKARLLTLDILEEKRKLSVH